LLQSLEHKHDQQPCSRKKTAATQYVVPWLRPSDRRDRPTGAKRRRSSHVPGLDDWFPAAASCWRDQRRRSRRSWVRHSGEGEDEMYRGDLDLLLEMPRRSLARMQWSGGERSRHGGTEA
jgi:hypothetical protein